MKKVLLAVLGICVAAPMVHAQGNFQFNNIFNAPGIASVTRESDGAYIGAEYTASLWYALGAVNDPALLVHYPAANTLFNGVTGGTPFGDGAGLFDGGVVNLTGISGQLVTVQVRAYLTAEGSWQNSWDSRGESNLIQVMLAAEGDGPQMDGLMPFTVALYIPEPSVTALLGLAGAALLVMRRRR